MRRVKRRRQDNEEIDNDNWMMDPGEKASRIWEWWRLQVYEAENSKLSFFAKSVRVVVSVQLSSCAVEQVFLR